MTRRPPAPIRFLVLLTAMLLLGAVVCARSSKGPEMTPAQPQAPAGEPADAGVGDAGATQQTPADQGNKPDKEFFPATKSAGDLF